MSAGIRFSVLGPLLVERDGVELDVGGPKQGVLLAALLLSPNRTVPVDRLVHLLWGEEPGPRAQSSLHVSVAKLRRTLEEHGRRDTVIRTVRPGYQVAADSDGLDLLAFHELAGRAREAMSRGDDRAASGLFDRALELPRGPLLADLADEEFVVTEARAFERALTAVTADSFECRLALGHHGEAVGPLQRLVADHPYDERLCALLMVALYRSGRQVDALAAYRHLRRTLAEELGVEPGPALEALELQILDHDAALSSAPLRSRFEEAPPTVTRATRSATGAHVMVDGARVPLRRVVTTIGRLADRHIVASHPDVSRRHAEIRRTSSGYVLVDVGSTNGTTVNGERVAEHLLRAGDRIEVGDTAMVFAEEGTGPPVQPADPPLPAGSG